MDPLGLAFFSRGVIFMMWHLDVFFHHHSSIGQATDVDAKTGSNVQRRGNLTKRPNMTHQIHRTVRPHASRMLSSFAPVPTFARLHIPSYRVRYGNTLRMKTCLCSQVTLPSSCFGFVFCRLSSPGFMQMLNLALEKQAIGRVHRLGQKRPVKASDFFLLDLIPKQ